MNGWMNKMCHNAYSGILFSPKNDGNSDTSYSMNEPWGHNAKGNKADAKE